MKPRHPSLLKNLRDILGTEGLLEDAAACHVYARDASHLFLGKPLAVALPCTQEMVQQVVACCREAGVPLVCRGTGTGLSGGAVPPEGAIVLATARLNRLGPVQEHAFLVDAQPGVLNTEVSRHAQGWGLHFAPDPSSQSAASIGGNIAENAGGPHCLRHGVTLQHVRQLTWVDAMGDLHSTGRPVVSERGFHLPSLLCGSEGTLGMIVDSRLNLVPDPAAVTTLLAFFPRLDDATRAVVRLLGQGLLPVAVEMVDQAMLVAVEKAFGFGFPTDVQAAMICEFAGSTAEVAEDAPEAAALLAKAGAHEVRQAADEEERLELWKCRKKAFGAVGRLAPSYVTMDVVVPLGQLPRLVARIQDIQAAHGVDIATAFHAGDGNLHPGVHYDDRDPEESRRAHAAADDIIAEALALGGSCTGEHGVGIEKLHVLPWQLDGESARLQNEIKRLFDPTSLLNPGKALPKTEGKFRAMPSLPRQPEFAWDSLTVTAPSDTPLAALQATALQKKFWIPIGFPGRASAEITLGNLFDQLHGGPALMAGSGMRDVLLETWARTGDGRTFHVGAPVFKNVAGYDLTHCLCGSGGVFATPLAMTLALRPIPEQTRVWKFRLPSGEPGAGLISLLDRLARRAAGTTGSTLVFDQVSGEGFLVAAGRDRSWDLQALPGLLAEVVSGLEVTSEFQTPFQESPEIWNLGLLPEWLVAGQAWTLVQRMCPGGAAIPPGQNRWVWQSRPGLWWAPQATEISGTGNRWHAEALVTETGFEPLPRPGPGVPLELIQRIKKLFDPDNTLGGPTWLTAPEES